MSSVPSTPQNNQSLGASGSASNIPKNKSPVRGNTPTTMSSGGVSRTRSTRTTPGGATTARAAARKPASREAKSTEDEDSRAEAAQLIEDLKEQLRKTEAASEDYQKQLTVLQSRLDEALGEQTKLEETSLHHAETASGLQVQLRDAERSKNEMEVKFEDEQQANNAEREAAATREAELNEVISRLKESLSSRESRRSIGAEGSLSRAASMRGRASPNTERPPIERRDSSQNSAQLLLQKDKIIESLRLELAEASLKVMEVDRAGGGRLQALEKQLLEVRMSNAKLMEDNESYQYLLQEKTITGQFANKFSSASSEQPHLSRAASTDAAGGNLADELETVGEEGESPVTGRSTASLERELAQQKEQNRAMTLYINKIISKLMATDSFEHLFETGSVTGDNPLNAARQAQAKAQADKELPQPPAGDDEAGKENVGTSLLQRAGSIFGGKRARPRSYQPPVTGGTDTAPRSSMDFGGPLHEPSMNLTAPSSFTTKPLPQHPFVPSTEDPNLSTRVPLTRGPPRSHRRTTSEISTSSSGYPHHHLTASRAVSGGGLSPVTSPDTSSGGVGVGVGSGAGDPPFDYRRVSLSAMSPSTESGMTDSSFTPMTTATTSTSTSSPPSSPPRSVAASSVGASSADGVRASGGTATMTSGKTMRPLRLVQEKAEQDALVKKANRGSWMGWLTKGPGAQGALGGSGPPGAGGGPPS